MSDKQTNPTKTVVMDSETLAIVEQLVIERHFGGQGFSLGVRTIIREWSEQRKTQASIDRQYEHFRTELAKVPELDLPRGNDQGAPEPVANGAADE